MLLPKINRSIQFAIALFVMIFSVSLIIPTPVVALNNSELSKQQAISNVTVCAIGNPQIATDITKFPDVQLNVRFINNQRSPMTNVISNDLQVQENTSSPIFVKSILPGAVSGADFYFVIDSGNRTNPLVAKKILESFYEIMLDGSDKINLMTSENSSFSYLETNLTSKDKFYQVIQAMPTVKNPDFYYLYSALAQTMKDIDINSNSCGRPLFLIIISGDLSFEGYERMNLDYSNSFDKTYTKMIFIHSGLETNQEYKTFSENLNGQYIDVPSVDQISQLTKLVTDISAYRKTHNIIYRTGNGGSGAHEINMLYQGQQVSFVGNDSYSVQLDTPSIVLSTEDNQILRVATKRTEEGYLFNTEQKYIDFTVDWKSYPRDITSVKLFVNDAIPVDVKVTKISNTEFRIPWDLSGFDQRGTFPVKIVLQITDELNEGVVTRVFSGETSVEIINRVPASLMTTWLLYGLYILFGLMIIAFSIWRKQITSSLLKGGKSVGDIIRKTIVGNRNSRKTPIANLNITDGPQNMIGKQLPVYSDSITLGRDPAKADLTFFGPDSLTSVSGLHCKIERLMGGWRIVALSSSRSETFINDDSIPFTQPVDLLDGYKVRMGYYGQQPVEFTFNISISSSESINDPRKTDTIKGNSIGLKKQGKASETDLAKPNSVITDSKPDSFIQPPSFPIKDESDKKDGSIFDEFR